MRGSIAQRWRGIVGTGSIHTGYIKDYSYDKRLQTTSPPYFPPWANGDWAAETTGGCRHRTTSSDVRFGEPRHRVTWWHLSCSSESSAC